MSESNTITPEAPRPTESYRNSGRTRRPRIDYNATRSTLDPFFEQCPKGRRIPLYVIGGNEVKATHFPADPPEALQVVGRYPGSGIILSTMSVPDDAPLYRDAGWKIPEHPYALAIRCAPRFATTHPMQVEEASLWVAESIFGVFADGHTWRHRAGQEVFVITAAKRFQSMALDVATVVLARIESNATEAMQAASSDLPHDVWVVRSPGVPIPLAEVADRAAE